MQWNGKEITTYGDVSDAMGAIYAVPDEAERQRQADAFMEAYRAENEHADSNVGYLTGYNDPETMVGMLRLFKTRHPIFGGPSEAAEVTPEQAFEMGQEAMTEHLKK